LLLSICGGLHRVIRRGPTNSTSDFDPNFFEPLSSYVQGSLGSLCEIDRIAARYLDNRGEQLKGLADIRAEVARTGGNVAFCIDPNDASDALPIAKTLEAAGVYFVTWWSKPADVKAWDYPHWVAHIAMKRFVRKLRTAQPERIWRFRTVREARGNRNMKCGCARFDRHNLPQNSSFNCARSKSMTSEFVFAQE
jgi:hypothetical protein